MALLLIRRLLLPATWSRSTATVKLGHNLFPRPTEDKPASKTDRRRERGKSSEKRPNCQLNIYTIQRSLGVENRHRQLRVHHLAHRIGMRRCSRRMDGMVPNNCDDDSRWLSLMIEWWCCSDIAYLKINHPSLLRLQSVPDLQCVIL